MLASMANRKTAQIIVLTDEKTKEQVSAIAASAGVSRAAVVRSALKYGLRFAVRDGKLGKLK